MNKIAVLVVLLALTAFHTEAKKSKKHELEKDQKEVEENKEPDESEEKGEFPGFALRIPIPNFGALSHIREQLDSLFTGAKPEVLHDKSGKTKTTTTTNNSTHGPFKTYSVTSETVSTDNKSSPHILSKVYKSITTLDKDKLPKGKDGKVNVPSPLEFDFGPFGPQFHDDSGERCEQTADCKNAQYCDAFLRVCRERLGDGAACTQKDQCDGKYRCTWGRCIKNSEEGSSGTFCDSDSECHSTDEELSCREQPDISRFSRVCMAKLGEGATCGHSSLFDLFRRAEDVSNYCKKGLVCRTVGFFGRRACIRGYEEDSEDSKSVNDKPAKKEIKSSKSKEEQKDKKIKFQ